MKIKFLDEIWEVDNKPDAVEEYLLRMKESLHSDLFIDYMVVDGIEVFNDFGDHILDRLDEISYIEVNTISAKQYIDNLLLSSKNYMERALPVIPQLAGQFYQYVTQETWLMFDQLLEGLQWVIDVMDQICNGPVTYQKQETFEQLYQKLRFQFEELANAVQVSDHSLVGDIIQYEINEIMIEFNQIVNQTIDLEVVRNDLN